MNIDIKVVQGEVHVNSITIMQESEECVVYHVETKTKRPEVSAETDKSIILELSDNGEEEYKPTIILFDVPEGWYKVFQTGKYYVNVVLYKRIEHSEDAIVWWDEMDLLYEPR